MPSTAVPVTGDPVDEQRLRFARECADPDWSLSIPAPAKAVIRDLITSREHLQAGLAAARTEVDRLTATYVPTETCPRCEGRGYHVMGRVGDAWPAQCLFCGGSGKVPFNAAREFLAKVEEAADAQRTVLRELGQHLIVHTEPAPERPVAGDEASA